MWNDDFAPGQPVQARAQVTPTAYLTIITTSLRMSCAPSTKLIGRVYNLLITGHILLIQARTDRTFSQPGTGHDCEKQPASDTGDEYITQILNFWLLFCI